MSTMSKYSLDPADLEEFVMVSHQARHWTRVIGTAHAIEQKRRGVEAEDELGKIQALAVEEWLNARYPPALREEIYKQMRREREQVSKLLARGAVAIGAK